MNEEYLNKNKVIANAMWATVGVFMLASWVTILFVPEHWRIGGMFSATACTMAALAATFHMRCYAVRLACLLRTTSNLPIDGAFDGPRPVREG